MNCLLTGRDNVLVGVEGYRICFKPLMDMVKKVSMWNNMWNISYSLEIIMYLDDECEQIDFRKEVPRCSSIKRKNVCGTLGLYENRSPSTSSSSSSSNLLYIHSVVIHNVII